MTHNLYCENSTSCPKADLECWWTTYIDDKSKTKYKVWSVTEQRQQTDNTQSPCPGVTVPPGATLHQKWIQKGLAGPAGFPVPHAHPSCLAPETGALPGVTDAWCMSKMQGLEHVDVQVAQHYCTAPCVFHAASALKRTNQMLTDTDPAYEKCSKLSSQGEINFCLCEAEYLPLDEDGFNDCLARCDAGFC